MTAVNVHNNESDPSDQTYVYVRDPGVGSSKHAQSAVLQQQIVLPDAFDLGPAYPNPFNPVTELRFALPEPAHVTLTVYDVMGRAVATLINQEMRAGYHQTTFEASNLPSGVYFVQLQAGVFSKTRRVVLLK